MNNKDYIDIAKKNEVADNISASPIKFAYRYTDKKDIEVSGLIALWMSYGNREEYEKVVERLLEIVMDNSPYNFIMSREYEKCKDNYTCLYRLTTWHNFAMLCNHLYNVYSKYSDLEEAVISNLKENKFEYYYQSLCDLICEEALIQSPKSTSSCWRMNLYIRFMSRCNSKFDLGIWYNIMPSRLMVTCNDKAIENAKNLNIITRGECSKANMIKITEFAKNIFRNDPSRMDYVLLSDL